jgi:hypothetical protein
MSRPRGPDEIFFRVFDKIRRLAYAHIGNKAYEIVPLIMPFLVYHGEGSAGYKSYSFGRHCKVRTAGPTQYKLHAANACLEKSFQAAYYWHRDSEDLLFEHGPWDTASDDAEGDTDDGEQEPGEVSLRMTLEANEYFSVVVARIITNYVGDFSPFTGTVQRVVMAPTPPAGQMGRERVDFILPVGQNSVVGIRRHKVHAFNMNTGEPAWPIQAQRTPQPISNAFCGGNSSMYGPQNVVVTIGNCLSVVSGVNGTRMGVIMTTHRATMRAAPLPNGYVMYWDSMNSEVKAFNANKAEEALIMQPRKRKGEEEEIFKVLMLSSETQLAVVADVKRVQLWEWRADLQEFMYTGGFKMPHRVFDLVELQDGRLLVRGQMNYLVIMEIPSFTITKLEGHANQVSCMTELFDGRIVSGSFDNCVHVWKHSNVQNKWITEFTLRNHCGAWDMPNNNERHMDIGGIRGVVELPGGLIASCGVDRSICIWSTHTGDLVNVLLDHDYLVNKIARIGRYLVSGDINGTMIVWM